MSEVFQNKKALYHYSPTLFLSVTTRSSAVVSDVTYLDSRSCQNLVGLECSRVIHGLSLLELRMIVHVHCTVPQVPGTHVSTGITDSATGQNKLH